MGGQVEALVCSELRGPFEPRTVLLGDFLDDELVVQMVATGICHTDYACANVSARCLLLSQEAPG